MGLIVVGRLALRGAQLSDDKRAIYSDYNLLPSQVLSDKANIRSQMMARGKAMELPANQLGPR
jgi:hypothetical protein